MSMAYTHERIYEDFNVVFTGLLGWEKADLSLEFVEQYVDDLDQCHTIGEMGYHLKPHTGIIKSSESSSTDTGATTIHCDISYATLMENETF